jgi:hypothetical protein
MSLDAVQRWMQDVIVDPADDSTVEARNREAAARWVRPSATLDAYERVSVYRDMYLMRMEEALLADFPALARFLGEHGFAHFVADYVQVHPSVHYNLNRLSDHVPDFVAHHGGIRSRTFATELARLELTITEVFDMACEPSRLTRAELDRVPPDAWDRARLVPIAALRVLAFDHAVNPFLQAVLDQTELPSTGRRKSWVAVYRQGFAMARLDLGAAQFRVLSALLEGDTLYDAFMAGTQGRGKADPGEVLGWIADWVSEGMFDAVRLDAA